MKKEKKTSIEQAIDDLLASGIPENIPLGKLKEYLKENKKTLDKAEEKFKSHIYPQYTLNWNKNYINNFEIMKEIDTYSISIFTIISKLINKNNLIQLSLIDIINITNYSKPKIIKSINELI